MHERHSFKYTYLLYIGLTFSLLAFPQPGSSQDIWSGLRNYGDILNSTSLNTVINTVSQLPAAGSVLGYLQSGCEECPPELEIVDFPCDEMDFSTPIWSASDAALQETLDDTRARYEKLRSLVKKADPSATFVLTSAYRAADYQSHLYSIYKGRQYRQSLSSSCKVPCSTNLVDIDRECSRHGICKNPVARNSSHSSGKAFDIGKGTTGKLSDCQLFGLARKAGLSLLIECRAYHFVSADKPQCARQCGGPYTVVNCGFPGQNLVVSATEQIQGDEGEEFIPPVWNLNIGGMDFTSIFPSIFSLAGIYARDQFGPGGPGTAPDGIADEATQLVGACIDEGRTRYVFSDPIRIENGKILLLKNLTYTDVPPLKPASIAIDPATMALDTGASGALTVIATTVEGATQEVTARESWTLYESSVPAVATVDLNGNITALSKGTTTISATNGKASAQCVVTVTVGTRSALREE